MTEENNEDTEKKIYDVEKLKDAEDMTVCVPPEIKTYIDSCASIKRWGLTGKKEISAHIFHKGLAECDKLFADLDNFYNKIMHAGNPYDENTSYFLHSVPSPLPFSCNKKVRWYATKEDLGRVSEKASIYGMVIDEARITVIIAYVASDKGAHIGVQRYAAKKLKKIKQCSMVSRQRNLALALEYATIDSGIIEE